MVINMKEVFDNAGERLVRVEQCFAQSKTNDVVWDAGLVLCYMLVKSPELVRGKTVLELGAGTGVVGLTAWALGAKRVVLTDLEEALPHLHKNVSLNLLDLNNEVDRRSESVLSDTHGATEDIDLSLPTPARKRKEPPSSVGSSYSPTSPLSSNKASIISVERLCWGNDADLLRVSELFEGRGGPDVILMSDCLYQLPDCVPLVQTLLHLTSLQFSFQHEEQGRTSGNKIKVAAEEAGSVRVGVDEELTQLKQESEDDADGGNESGTKIYCSHEVRTEASNVGVETKFFHCLDQTNDEIGKLTSHGEMNKNATKSSCFERRRVPFNMLHEDFSSDDIPTWVITRKRKET
ncbi:unnamed protein product [Amoebophrya sp. A25]|nr:unnamed protein product [Amoebophrya sp. A25]|eukprot:GSA25T00013565001.1